MHRTVETARKMNVMRGMVIAFRWGSVSLVGCCECVSQQCRATTGQNLLLGWWSFVGLIATPLTLLQNVYNLSSRPNSKVLKEVLSEVGYRVEDVSLGNDGLSGEQRQLLRAAAAALKSIAQVEGTTSAEWEQARDALVALADGSLTPSAADRLLREVKAEELNRSHFDQEQRHVLLRIAIDVATADGTISEAEDTALGDLGVRLGFDRAFVRTLIENLRRDGVGDQTGDLSAARRVLGVAEDAGVGEIRSAYKRLMLKHHPDRAAPDEREEATRRASEINAAYNLLIGRSGTSNGSTPPRARPEPPPQKPPSQSQPKPPPPKPKPPLCSACQRRVSETAKFCGYCGTKLAGSG
jgi:DnaJ-domain-containing protein 1